MLHLLRLILRPQSGTRAEDRALEVVPVDRSDRRGMTPFKMIDEKPNLEKYPAQVLRRIAQHSLRPVRVLRRKNPVDAKVECPRRHAGFRGQSIEKPRHDAPIRPA